jgi:uncharacterized protein (UPF0548 family)
MQLSGRGDRTVLQRALVEARDEHPDAPNEVVDGGCPQGFQLLTREVLLGQGTDTFRRAGLFVLDWEMHRRSGLVVAATHPRAVPGADVALGASFGPVMFTQVCRVLEVYEDEHQHGFSYATLPGHPECGREDFVVNIDENDRVWFRIRAVSRPSTRLAKLGGPITSLLQRRANDAYVAAMESS